MLLALHITSQSMLVNNVIISAFVFYCIHSSSAFILYIHNAQHHIHYFYLLCFHFITVLNTLYLKVTERRF